MTFTFAEILQIALYFMNIILPYLLIGVGVVFGSYAILWVVNQVRLSL